MKKIGLIGGMSWESSALYYRLINERVRDRLGGLHSARCVMGSVDFAEVERMQTAGEWAAAGGLLAEEARSLEAAGAEAIVLCTNTMHKVASDIESAVGVPLLHLVDVTGEAVNDAGLSKVVLLGTRFTMEEQFYRERMEANGVQTVVPDAGGRATVDRVIYEELVLGIVSDESRREFQRIIEGLITAGAEGVILGCTEIELLVGESDVTVPVFASTALHAAAAVDFALAEGHPV
ncbi:aspartate/glutamate racemase family protein [Microbacterium halotolerans]|uniref:aspartate/glutamate racemase family protein n=1 Tax=Microbacterium halotolerans TaxID=246613 RepID=UPI000E6ADF03|nr:aspartate/glutamate racemase family protein [Microbacterium halotolerans]